MCFHAWLLRSIYLFITDGGKMRIRRENESRSWHPQMIKNKFILRKCELRLFRNFQKSFLLQRLFLPQQPPQLSCGLLNN